MKNSKIYLFLDPVEAADSGGMEEEDLGPGSTPGGAVTPPPPGQGTQGGPDTRMVFLERLKQNCIL